MLIMLTRLWTEAPDHPVVPDIGPRLFTIGYQGYSRDAYLAALEARSVTVLCDVRRTATSRNATFARLALSRACEKSGIRYEHLWQLGAHSEGARGRWARDDRESRFEDYRLRTLPNQQPLLERIHGWLLNGERVALTCFERRPGECHRSCVADQLQKTYGGQCSPIHL